jgi:hypothetical protein
MDYIEKTIICEIAQNKVIEGRSKHGNFRYIRKNVARQ